MCTTYINYKQKLFEAGWVWGQVHFKTIYKENKRDLQHQAKQATRIIIRMNIICNWYINKSYNTLDKNDPFLNSLIKVSISE